MGRRRLQQRCILPGCDGDAGGTLNRVHGCRGGCSVILSSNLRRPLAMGWSRPTTTGAAGSRRSRTPLAGRRRQGSSSPSRERRAGGTGSGRIAGSGRGGAPCRPATLQRPLHWLLPCLRLPPLASTLAQRSRRRIPAPPRLAAPAAPRPLCLVPPPPPPVSLEHIPQISFRIPQAKAIHNTAVWSCPGTANIWPQMLASLDVMRWQRWAAP